MSLVSPCLCCSLLVHFSSRLEPQLGINTVRADGMGLSFAMKIDTALDIITQLSEQGRVVRPFLGLSFFFFSFCFPGGLVPDSETNIQG